MSGELAGNGELGDLQWVTLARAQRLPLAPITGLVLDLLARLLSSGSDPADETGSYRALIGRELVELHRPDL